jgi:hypothetical protein
MEGGTKGVRAASALAGVLAAGACWLAALAPALAAAQPVDMAAPYEYLGWGSPQAPASVLAASGVSDLTLAFVLSRGACNPEWDGSRPLLGGSDQAAIASIRAAGGDVVASFGGWSGKKLGNSCRTPAALAGAYQKVIDAYALRSIDRRIGRLRGHDARADVDRELLVTRRDPELDHLGAEAVEMAAHPGLGLDARVELVAALR